MATAPYDARSASPQHGRIPTKFYSIPVSVGVDNNGVLSGNVSEQGGGVFSYCLVRIYYRPTGQLIREVRTDLSGNYSLPGLDATDAKNYYAVALDPDASPDYNAMIFDRVTPKAPATTRYLQQQLNAYRDAQFGTARSEHYLYEQLQSLLLHFEGTNGSTTFTDSSLRTKTVSVAGGGNGAISTARAQFGSASLSISTGYLSTPDHVDFQFGSNDFTIEAWIYPTSIPGSGNYRGVCGRRTSSGDMAYTMYLSGDFSGALTFELNSSSNVRLGMAQAGVPTANAWNHVAAVRSGSTLTAYLNGTAGTPVNIGATPAYTGSYVFQIGSLSLGGSPFAGNIDEMRVINGFAIYTSNFTPAGPFSP